MLNHHGFDGQNRSAPGRITAKHGQTRIGTLRQIFGRGFAETAPDSAKLKDVLHKLNMSSLSQLYRHVDDGSLDGKIKAAEAAANDAKADALKRRS